MVVPCAAYDWRTSQDPNGLRQAVDRAIYRMEPSGSASFRGRNPAQRLAVEFDAHQARLKHPLGNLMFRVTGYPSAAPARNGDRVEYRRGELTEWYQNDARGLEQGFTLAHRPSQYRANEPLVLRLAVEGDLRPVMAPGGEAVLLQRDGQTVLRYAGLRSWDARGRMAPSHLDVRGREIRLVVEDSHAEYPLVVDPTWTQQAEMVASDGATGDDFGYSVAVSGNTAVVGAPDKLVGPNIFQGVAYVFVRSGSNWTQQAELAAFDGAAGDQFGYSVSISGDTVVIGAPFKGEGLSIIQGAAYIFMRTGTTWAVQAEILSSDGEPFDFFGTSVSVNADTAVVTAAGKNSDQGAAYVFVRSGTVWNQQQELTAFDGAGGDEFGTSVSLSGDTVAVGAQTKNGDQGAIYVFVRNGTAWSSLQEVVASDRVANDNFGRSVALSGNTLVVGAPQKTIGSNIMQGAAYVLIFNGTSWTQQQELTATDGTANDGFGSSVSLTGDTAVIGAPGKSINAKSQQGAVYQFGRTGTTWTQQQELTATDGTLNDDFGFSVSIGIAGTTGTIVAGAPGKKIGQTNSQGAVYAFSNQGGVGGGGGGSGLAALSVSPSAGSGATQVFTAVYTDAAGASDIQVVYLDFGNSSFAANSCIVAYVQASNTLSLFNDGTTGLVSGSVTPNSSGTVSNSQCTISGNGGAVAAAGNSLTVPVSILFTPGFAGPKNIYGQAQNYGGTSSGWQMLGTWTPGSVLSAVSVSPGTGSGASQTFTAVYNDPAGASDIQVAYLTVGTAAGSAHSCWVAYVQAGNSLSLFNDAGTGVVSGSITPGAGNTLSNSQCTLASGGPVMASGGNLSVPFTLTFAAGFTGAKSVYGSVQSYSGSNSGWQTLGTWTVSAPPPITATSVSPINAGGATQTFTAVYTDPNGGADLQVVYLDFGGSPFGARSCIASYVQASQMLFLFNDASSGLVSGSIAVGSSGTLSNSQCTLSGTGGLPALSGNNLTVPFAITFNSGFTGSQNVYGNAQNYAGVSSGWQMLGAWTPNAPAVITTVSVTPGSGSGLTQTFSAVYRDTNGATDLQVVYLDFGTAIFAANSCIAFYVQAGNTLSLYNDAGTAPVAGSLTAGGSGSLSNSQCTLSSGGAATTSGNNLTVPFAITFAAGFQGAQRTYALAQNYNGITSGWQTLGSWTPSSPTVISAASVSPSSGGGISQTFNATYTDSNGGSDLQAVYLDFGTAVFSARSCIVLYVQSNNTLSLFNDTSTGVVPGTLTAGGSGSVSNSQCTLSGNGGSVALAGNTLSVPFAITFASGFSGSKNIYGYAQNYAGKSTGWQTLGTWAPITPLAAVSVSPNNGSGVSKVFTGTYSDPVGGSDLQVVYLDFGNSAFSPNSCVVVYVQASNTLSLFNDAGTALVSASATPGGSGLVSNSQCTITGNGGPVTVAGSNLIVPVAVSFAGAFTGSKSIFGLAQSYSGSNSGWQNLGTWTPVLGAVSMTPVNGAGFGPQTFTTVFTDGNGAADLQVVYLDFGAGVFTARSCIVAYVQSSNSFSLFNDATTGLVPGSITPGGPGTLSNTQCTISGSGGAVTPTGANLNVPLSITFANGFAGSKNVYAWAQSYSGSNGGWQTMGTWNP